MLSRWLEERLSALEFPPKLIPTETHVRAATLSFLRKAIAEWARQQVDEIMRPDILGDKAMQIILRHFDTREGSLGLEEAIRRQPFKSWKMVLAEITAKRFQDALTDELENMARLVQNYK